MSTDPDITKDCTEVLGSMTRYFAAMHDIVECSELPTEPTREQIHEIGRRSLDRCGTTVSRTLSRGSPNDRVVVTDVLVEVVASLARDLVSRIEALPRRS